MSIQKFYLFGSKQCMINSVCGMIVVPFKRGGSEFAQVALWYLNEPAKFYIMPIYYYENFDDVVPIYHAVLKIHGYHTTDIAPLNDLIFGK